MLLVNARSRDDTSVRTSERYQSLLAHIIEQLLPLFFRSFAGLNGLDLLLFQFGNHIGNRFDLGFDLGSISIGSIGLMGGGRIQLLVHWRAPSELVECT